MRPDTRHWIHSPVATQALTQLAAVALLAAAARVAIPLPGTPVPVTLQPVAVLLVAGLLGAVPGALAVGTYVLAGALGLPLFAGGGAGLPWLMGPTGGYLAAFPVAAFVTGRVLAGRTGLLRTALGTGAGLAIIFLGGVSQLALVSGQGLGGAFRLGVLPFLPGAVIQAALAAALLAAIRGGRGVRG
ncbi:MAG: biotin transporter BioY [Gemmatimonadota bacterium]